MSKSRPTILSLVIALAVTVSAAGAPARDVLYQTATIDALMAGLYDGQMRVGELTKHGNLGLGTFDRLDGEMVVVDGIVYQVTSDGVAHKADSTMTTPFAAVTFFDRDKTAASEIERDLGALQEYIDRMLPSKNLFYAIRIDGTFARVKTRSVPSQSKPYPKLVDVVARQPIHELTDVKGTIVGFRCPYYVTGVNVPGYHMHFLTADRKRGGHLLDCTVKSALVTVDVTPEFELSLPQNKEFYDADLDASTQKDLEKVEQGRTGSADRPDTASVREMTLPQEGLKVRRYRLNQLPETDARHVFGGIVGGEFISVGGMFFKSPGQISHADEQPHVHDDEEVFVILQGKARIRFDDGIESYSAGDVIVIEPRENHHFESDREDPCINLSLRCGPTRHPDQVK
jgi:acetolactate decarboxylase